MESVSERFLRYAAVDTQSDEESDACPSTPGQWTLARLLAGELRAMGAGEVQVDENGYVTATIPGSGGAADVPPVGLIAHMDTSPDLSGKEVRARVVRGYDGGDVVLNEERGIVLSPAQFPVLRDLRGQDLIVTDGTTLLGGDDKAGVAEIMAAAETLLQNPGIRHAPVRLCFTPDEEIGRGADRFDVPGFGAPVAYTVDGGAPGELEYENFNAADARVTVHGVNIHPGSAKGKMKNSILIAMELHAMLPAFENPAYTEGYEGFSHLETFRGSVEQTKLRYIVRDHDAALFEQKKQRFLKIASYLNDKYGAGTVEVELRDSYRNMREKILERFDLIETARRAMEDCGVQPVVIPIRGGTDGARLSYADLPCPNLFTGGYNAHGRYEFLSIQAMEQAVRVLVRITELFAGA